MATYLELAKELEQKTGKEFYIEDNVISSQFMDDILEIDPDEEVDKRMFKQKLFLKLVDDYEWNMQTYYIKKAEDAMYAGFDAKTLGNELRMIENF